MMSEHEKVVDGFRFMPPSLSAWIGKDIPDPPYSGEIAWTPLDKPLKETTFTLVTTAGISTNDRIPGSLGCMEQDR